MNNEEDYQRKLRKMLDYKKLVTEFKRIGLKEKDVVLVHSSFKSFGEVEGGPQTVVDALISH